MGYYNAGTFIGRIGNKKGIGSGNFQLGIKPNPKTIPYDEFL